MVSTLHLLSYSFSQSFNLFFKLDNFCLLAVINFSNFGILSSLIVLHTFNLASSIFLAASLASLSTSRLDVNILLTARRKRRNNPIDILIYTHIFLAPILTSSFFQFLHFFFKFCDLSLYFRNRFFYFFTIRLFN